MKTRSSLVALLIVSALFFANVHAGGPGPVPSTGGVTSVNSNTGAVTGAQAVAGAAVSLVSITSPTGNRLAISSSDSYINVSTQALQWDNGSNLGPTYWVNVGQGLYIRGSAPWIHFSSDDSVGIYSPSPGVLQFNNGTAGGTTSSFIFLGSLTHGATGTAVKNRRFVTATLASGAVTVSDTAITATTQIYPSNYTTTGSVGIPYVSSKTAGTGYTITSGNSAATNQVSVEIVDF